MQMRPTGVAAQAAGADALHAQPPELSWLEERANLIKALKLTEAALVAASGAPSHYRLIDLYLDTLRELQDLIDANMRKA